MLVESGSGWWKVGHVGEKWVRLVESGSCW